ncbi:MAG: hypothetical protein IPG34_19930 [Rhodocyclaceae bacterium]|nr:hypothetical protein [Rhodocyclaceae bacterium]
MARKRRQAEAERYTRVRRAIWAFYGSSASDRCRNERGYAILDGMRFGVTAKGALAVQAQPAQWHTHSYGSLPGWWDERAFAVLNNAASLSGLGKMSFDFGVAPEDDEVDDAPI